MTSSKRKPTTSPPPRAVMLAIRNHGAIPHDELMAWYRNDAPEWIREAAISPDIAVFLWKMPSPRAWDHMSLIFTEKSR